MTDDMRRFVSLVYLNDFTVLDSGDRFDLGDGRVLEVTDRFGSDTSADICVQFVDGDGRLWVPMPSEEGIRMFSGRSTMLLEVPKVEIPSRIERTRAYLREHPVEEKLLDPYSDDVPRALPGNLGVWGDEREYAFPDELRDVDLWWETPLFLMDQLFFEPDDDDIFVNRYYCWEEPDYHACAEVYSMVARPNFLFRPTGFEVVWYKHVPRSMWMNQPLTPREIMHIMELCRQSIGDRYELPTDDWDYGDGCEGGDRDDQ